jgi:tetratricopeptide (TPR) repeat protein
VHPDWSRIYTLRGVTLAKLKRYDEALGDWAKAIELDPDNAKGWRGASHRNRIGLYADTGQPEKALAECEEAFKVKANANDPYQCYFDALFRLQAGRCDDYRTRCAAMLDRFHDSQKAEAAHLTAWTCSLAPDAVTDLASVVALARRAAEKNPNSVSYVQTLGGALYRAGQFEDAARCLQQIDALPEEADSDEHSPPAYGWYFLAMARHRLGNEEEATKWLNKAIDWTNRALKEHKREGGETLSWNRRATLELLRREAEEVLKTETEREGAKPKPEEARKTP